jgi:hypothetical protein
METSTLPFSPFDHDVNVLVLKRRYINDYYFDNLLPTMIHIFSPPILKFYIYLHLEMK